MQLTLLLQLIQLKVKKRKGQVLGTALLHDEHMLRSTLQLLLLHSIFV